MINSIKPIICSGGSMNGMPMMKIDFGDVLDESALQSCQIAEQAFSWIIEGWKHPWVQLAGKEPCSQHEGEFTKLMKMLINGGYHVHLETGGTIADIPCKEMFKWITLIPTDPSVMNPYHVAFKQVHEIKFLVKEVAGLDWICNTVGKWYDERRKPVIQIHPVISMEHFVDELKCYEYEPGLIQACKELCLKNGWNLSIDSVKLAME